MWLASSLSRLLSGRKETTMAKKNYTKLDKITLVGCIDKALD
jgi:hypothetical protein